ncbi:MAG: glycosyltransferase family 1 protein [Planctomycetota bacterium]
MSHFGIDYRPALWNRAGIARYVRESVRALAEIDQENRYSLYAYFWKADAVPPPDLPWRFTLHRRRVPGRLIRFFERYLGHSVERILGGDLDAMHLTDYIYPRVRPATPLIVTLYDLSFERDTRYHGEEGARILRERVRGIVPRAGRILTISEASKIDILERYRLPEEKVHVARPGVDHILRGEELLPEGLPSELILAVGTLEPRKNHLRLLEAHARLEDAPPLVIVGARGWEDDDIIGAIRSAEPGRVIWLENTTEPELRALYRRALFLAYPSLDEGFGLPAAEALALGCPVLTSDRPALLEATGGHALTVDPGSISALTDGLSHLLEHPPTTEARDSAAEWAKTLTWRRCAESQLALYRSLAASR